MTTLAAKGSVVLRRQAEVFRAWRSVGIERGIAHSRETIAGCFDLADRRANGRVPRGPRARLREAVSSRR